MSRSNGTGGAANGVHGGGPVELQKIAAALSDWDPIQMLAIGSGETSAQVKARLQQQYIDTVRARTRRPSESRPAS